MFLTCSNLPFYVCSMQILGSPISKTASAELPELTERFWFWRGASGQNYIHSVYAPDACPPLPGAVYVGVRRTSGMRLAVAVGRFGPFWDHARPAALSENFTDCDEIHVHLLARSPQAAESVRTDLLAAMLEDQPRGLSESQSHDHSSDHVDSQAFQTFVIDAQLPQMQNRIGNILAA